MEHNWQITRVPGGFILHHMQNFDLAYAKRHYTTYAFKHAAEVALAKELGLPPPKMKANVYQNDEGKWVVAYHTASGAGRDKAFDSKEAADAFAAKKS